MANGRAAALEPHDALAGEPFLAIGEIAGRAASARILARRAAFARRHRSDRRRLDRGGGGTDLRPRLGVLAGAPPAPARRAYARRTDASRPGRRRERAALARGVLSLGFARLPWTKALKQCRDRVMFLGQAEGEAWPDLSDEALAADPAWLAPFLAGKTRLDDIGPDDLAAARPMLPGTQAARWMTRRRRISRRRPALPRRSTTKPKAARRSRLRVQELFGLNEHPSLAGGRIPLTLHLLSPANRPIQITRDLPGFWRGSWAAVRADLRGRYPRHFWPEDPAAAAPTTRAKPRGT